MKDQFVIVCLESPSSADTLLPYARHCSARLGKGIIVINVSKDGQSDWLKQYGLPYVGLKGDWKTVIDGLPTAFGGVLAVAAVNHHAPRTSITHPATLLKVFGDCKIAYLVVEECGSSLELPPRWPSATILTLDHRRESKEKLVWGAYMVRFFGTQLTVAVPDYSDGGLREKVKNNVLFMKKIYKSLNVDYTLKPFKLPRFATPDRAVLQWEWRAESGERRVATKHQPSTLLISMTTDKRDRDIGDLLFGNPERRHLSAAHIPILFLNQRDDLYVLCD